MTPVCRFHAIIPWELTNVHFKGMEQCQLATIGGENKVTSRVVRLYMLLSRPSVLILMRRGLVRMCVPQLPGLYHWTTVILLFTERSW